MKNKYFDAFVILSSIPVGANITSVTFNASQSLPPNINVGLGVYQATTLTTIVNGPLQLSQVPGIPGTDINGSVTFNTNLTIPLGNGTAIKLVLVAQSLPVAALNNNEFVNVTVKYVM